MRTASARVSTNGAAYSSAAYDDESFPNLRRALHPDLRSLPAEDIDEIVRAHFGAAVSAEDVEGFLDDVGKVMGKVGQNLGNNLPQIAMGAVQGAMVGGLPGAIAGAAIPAVGAALPAITGAVSPAPTGASGVGRPGAPVHAATAGGATGAAPAPAASGAAAQLLQMLTNPALFRSIVSALFQSSGAPKTVVGGTPTPVPAVLNAVSELAGRAAEEFSLGSDPALASLRGPSGEALDDPANALDRAESVARLFARPVPARGAPEAYGDDEAYDDEALADKMYARAFTEADYDEMDQQDLLELYAREADEDS